MSRTASPLRRTPPRAPAPRARFALAPVAAAAVACLISADALAQTPALPTLTRVVQGANTPTVNGATMSIQQTAARGVIEWSNFNIGAGGTVNIQQPTANAVLLNRVIGNFNGSRIDGALNANGHVFVLDPSGLTIGRSAAVNVGSLVASTMDISPDDRTYNAFLNGANLVLTGGGNNAASLFVESGATVNAAAGGNIVLLAGQTTQVVGDLVAPNGQIVLGAAGVADIPIGQSGYINLRLSPDPLQQEFFRAPPNVEVNSASIDAAGGQIRIEAAGLAVPQIEGPGILRPQVSLFGALIRSDSATGDGGRIAIQAGNEGAVEAFDTTISASSDRAAGGSIDVKGLSIVLGADFASEIGPMALTAEGTTRGGTIEVGDANTGNLLMLRDTEISANATSSSGEGGSVTLRADLLRTGRQDQLRIDLGVAELYGQVSAGGGTAGAGGTIALSGTALVTTRLDNSGQLAEGSFLAGSGNFPGTFQVDSGTVRVVTTPLGGGLGNDPVPLGATLSDDQISAALGQGNVALFSTESVVVDAGSRLQFSLPTAAVARPRTLSISARNDIVVGSNTVFGQGEGAAPLSINLVANRQDTGGAIRFQFDGESATSLITGGGNVFMGGGLNTTTGFADGGFGGIGVDLSGVIIDTRFQGTTGGDVTIRGLARDGEGPGTGVRLDTTSVLAGTTGVVTIEGRAEGGTAVELGIGGLSGAFLQAGGGIRIHGDAQATFGTPTGVQMIDAIISAGSGNVTIAGRGAAGPEASQVQGYGVRWRNSFIEIDPGAESTLRLIGDSDAEFGTGLGSTPNAFGETLLFVASSEGGNIAAANLEIGARSTGSGTAIEESSSPVFINTTGKVSVRPAGLDAEGDVVAADDIDIVIGNISANAAPVFRLSSTWMTQANLDPEVPRGFIAAEEVVIGSSTHTGRISLEGAAIDAQSHPRITLQNQGVGSQGIVLASATPGTASTNGDRQLTLMTSGPITFAAAPPITLFRLDGQDDLVTPLAAEPTPGALNLDSLVIVGGSNTTVDLQNTDNFDNPLPHRINHLSFTGVRSINLAAESALSVEALPATGYDSAALAFATTAPPTANTATERVRLVTDDAIQLLAPIRTSGAGSTIDLVAPTQFVNSAGAQALAAGTGGNWEVWTQTWSLGSRGGLNGSGGTPNAYGCDLSLLACSTAQLEATSSGFRYNERPELVITPSAVSVVQGNDPPAIAFSVTGLVNGDTLATAFSGSLGTQATASSAPGSYPVVQGALVSKQGYTLLFSPSASTAVTVLAAGDTPPASLGDIPGFDRSRALNSALLSAETNTEVHGRNLSRAQMCVAPGALRRQKDAGEDSDALGIEWSRVRSQPHLSSCLDLGDDSECAAF